MSDRESTPQLDALCRRTGITWQYRDGAGAEREAPVESRRAVLAAMGVDAATERAARDSLRALDAERRSDALVAPTDAGPGALEDALRRAGVGEGLAWGLTTAEGAHREGRGPASLARVLDGAPPGRLRLVEDPDAADGGEERTVLAAPRSLPLPDRAWGVTVPLYGLCPDGRLGTYRDLGRLVDGLAGSGASFVGINPVHAGFPRDPGAFSPYAPSSRRRFDVLHIAATSRQGGCEAVGATGAGAPSPLLDYGRETAAILAGHEQDWAGGAERPDLDALDPDLRRFAVHQALSEVHGPYWPDWPAAFRDPASADVGRFTSEHRDRVAFHAWLQLRAEAQLSDAARRARDAGLRHGLYLDLAVGTHPAGAETWGDAPSFARGVSLGAPPDAFAADGQTWGLAPLEPRELVRTGCGIFAETLRQQLRFAGILRIDHALGLERSFWVPEGLPGAYVRMPRDLMLATVRIEALRAGALVVGEDLGNVPEGIRAEFDASGLLGCRVAMFERDWQGDGSFTRAEEYTERALASFGTHDLPTWRGWRAGRDLAWRRRIRGDEADGAAAAREAAVRRAEVEAFDAVLATQATEAASAVDAEAPGVDAMHAFLARTQSVLVAVQAEDVLELDEQANLPGTVYEHPNWRRTLPVSPEDFGRDPRFLRAAATMRDAGR